MAKISKNDQPQQTPRGITKKLDLLDQKVDSLSRKHLNHERCYSRKC